MDKSSNTRKSLIRRPRKKNDDMPVQISYAHPDASVLLTLHVAPGTTIREAVELSGIQKIIKKARLLEGKVGIFGEIRSPDTLLSENDRIELYRPLETRPGDARKKRLKEEKSGTGTPEKPQK